MSKKEFLDILKESLIKEIPDQEIESNLQYYRDYISSGGTTKKSEEEVLEDLGDPRLIARTIINSYNMSRGITQRGYQQFDEEEDFNTENQYQEEPMFETRYFTAGSPKWYHKFLIIGIFILFLVAAIAIGGIVLNLFFTIGIPILIIWFIYRLIINLFRK